MVTDEFWTKGLVREVRQLMALRAIVQERNAKTKRWPKWRFRMSEDLVIQIQPYVETRRFHKTSALFRCAAIWGRALPADAFKEHAREFPMMNFSLDTIPNDTTWSFRPSGLSGQLSDSDAVAFRYRVQESLGQLEQLDAVKMFSPHCLVCGKKLTDAVSQARWLGPECAGTAALDAVRAWRVAA